MGRNDFYHPGNVSFWNGIWGIYFGGSKPMMFHKWAMKIWFHIYIYIHTYFILFIKVSIPYMCDHSLWCSIYKRCAFMFHKRQGWSIQSHTKSWSKIWSVFIAFVEHSWKGRTQSKSFDIHVYYSCYLYGDLSVRPSIHPWEYVKSSNSP